MVHIEPVVGLAHVNTRGWSNQPVDLIEEIFESEAREQAWASPPGRPTDAPLDQGRDEPPGHAVGVLRRAPGQAAQATAQDAIAIWQAVIAGRWSLVAHFDSDEHRCFVARRNEPALPAGSTLSERERQIVAYASLGHSNKLIAYELGLCSSTVAAQLTSAARKLGVSSRKTLLHVSAVLGSGVPELGELGGELAPPAECRAREPAVRVTRFVHNGQDVAVIRIVLAPELPTSLTAAERDVARLVIEGLSNAAIAARRSTSIRTVANQLRSIFAKLAVGSRRQLCSRFSIQ